MVPERKAGPRCVVITGGTGSFGQAVLCDLLQTDVEEIRIFSRDEAKQDAMRETHADRRIRYRIGDVRDRDSVEAAMHGADAVFHAAALKQVPSCEHFPLEAVRTNVDGSANVIRAARAAGVRSLVCLSTDKAVSPVNAMGLSKAMMERIALAAAREIGPGGPLTISVVRYGNVLGSRGSVVPLFAGQIARGEPLTVTQPDMTRFLMRLEQAVSLVRYAFGHAFQGDLFIRRVPAARISDLAEAVRRLHDAPNHPMRAIGWRPGEKRHETLATARELARAEDLGPYLRIESELRGTGTLAPADPDQVPVESVADYSSDRATLLDVPAIMALIRAPSNAVAPERRSAA